MKLLKLPLLLLLFLPFTAMAGNGPWLTDLDEAKALAKKEDKALLINFTGSDWCHFCVLLHDEVFEHASFLKEAQKDFVLVELDFPRKTKQAAALKKQNEALAELYGIQGFPTVILADETGKPFAKTGYQQGGVAPYLAHLKKALSRKDIH